MNLKQKLTRALLLVAVVTLSAMTSVNAQKLPNLTIIATGFERHSANNIDIEEEKEKVVERNIQNVGRIPYPSASCNDSEGDESSMLLQYNPARKQLCIALHPLASS